MLINKYTQTVQESFQLIVDLADPTLQIEKVLKISVWMAATDDYLQYDHMGMLLQLEEGSLFKVLEVKNIKVEPVEESGL